MVMLPLSPVCRSATDQAVLLPVTSIRATIDQAVHPGEIYRCCETAQDSVHGVMHKNLAAKSCSTFNVCNLSAVYVMTKHLEVIMTRSENALSATLPSIRRLQA